MGRFKRWLRSLGEPPPCRHPEPCREWIYNGSYWVKHCALCGRPFVVQEEPPC